jgi:hypothetical protein
LSDGLCFQTQPQGIFQEMVCRVSQPSNKPLDAPSRLKYSHFNTYHDRFKNSERVAVSKMP